MRCALAWILALVPACASPDYITYVRAPRQLVVVRVTDRGDVPQAFWRDVDGLPHVDATGDFELVGPDGIRVPSVERAGATIRLVAHLMSESQCRRSRRRCRSPRGEIAFITPAANVVTIREASPPEPLRQPVGH